MEVVIGRGSCDGTSHHRQAPGRRLGEAVRHWPTFEEVLASALTDCAWTQSQGELELELSDRNLSLPQTMMSTRLHHGQPHLRCPLLGNIQVAPLAWRCGARHIGQFGVSQGIIEGVEEENPKGRARRTLLLTTREIGDVDGGNSQIGHEGTEARRGPG
jgi:hypothetical protein